MPVGTDNTVSIVIRVTDEGSGAISNVETKLAGLGTIGEASGAKVAGMGRVVKQAGAEGAAAFTSMGAAATEGAAVSTWATRCAPFSPRVRPPCKPCGP